MSSVDDRLAAIETAISTLKPLAEKDGDIALLLDIARKERTRRTVDKWFQDRAQALFGKGKFVLAAIVMVLAFKDYLSEGIDHIWAFIEFSKGDK